jgi:hypothetical protein
LQFNLSCLLALIENYCADQVKARMEGTSICAVLVGLIDSPNAEVQANCAAALGSLSSSRKIFLSSLNFRK